MIFIYNEIKNTCNITDISFVTETCTDTSVPFIDTGTMHDNNSQPNEVSSQFSIRNRGNFTKVTINW